MKNVTSKVLPEAPVDETTFQDTRYKIIKMKFAIFTFCAFLPYKVGPPVSSVVISYLKQKLQMDNVDEKATFCWV